MARGNTPRWNWLMETYRDLPPWDQQTVRDTFTDRYEPAADRADDQVMYEIMIEFGIPLKGVDPHPPQKVYPSDAGAVEYEEIILIQEMGKVHDINNDNNA